MGVSLPSEDESEEICEAYTELEFAIDQIPAETWASVVAKARVAAEYAPPVNLECPLLDDMLTSLLADILRIAGEEPKRHTSFH